jgi:hypothetical protein
VEIEDMSENIRDRFEYSTNEELIDFALDHLGQEHESIRQLALQEHFLRVEQDRSTVLVPSGDVRVLRSKIAQLVETQSGR